MAVSYVWSAPFPYTNPSQLYDIQENTFSSIWAISDLCVSATVNISIAMATDPAKKAVGVRFRGGTGNSMLTTYAASESAPFYLLGKIPQMQSFVLFSPSPYPENFAVMNRVSSEERNCNRDGRQPAVVCRT